MGRLFSASDDGKVSLWDLHSEKLMQKYQNFDDTGNINGTANGDNSQYNEMQVSHSMDLRSKNSCPTALSCSISGQFCFAAYTDDSLHMIDVRSPEIEHFFKSGGHSGMIKSIWVSEDESILYTGGSDGTMRLWDIGTRSVIHVYGEQKN